MKKFIQKYSKKPVGLFKFLYVNFLFSYIPFGLLHIIFNLLGIIPVNFNDKPIYGLGAVLVILLFTPFIVLLLTVGVWIYFIIGNLFLRFLNKLLS
ncbi:hypothetical protein [Flavobacterium beibuense]|uniref:hypothetical protein n=1 Tax=Flavobacterium beibuense TaxID=657326 RepID=UPI003A94D2F1